MTRRDSKLDDALKNLHSQNLDVRGEHRDRLEEQLSARYRERHDPSWRWTMIFDFRNPPTRWAMIALAILVFGIGACSTPTTSELEMGQSLRFEIPADASKEFALQEMLSGPEGLTEFLGAQPGVDEVNLSITENIDGPMVIEVLTWGDQLNANELVETVTAKYPILDEAVLVDTSALTGRVKENLGKKFGRSVLSLDIDGATEEEVRAQILMQLKAQGFDGGAVVDVMQDGDVMTIDIEMSDSAEGYETEDVIEIRTSEDLEQIEIGGDEGGEVSTTTSNDGQTVKKTVEVKKEE